MQLFDQLLMQLLQAAARDGYLQGQTGSGSTGTGTTGGTQTGGSTSTGGTGTSTGTGSPAGGVNQPVSNISAVWANEGGDKVTQDELRATKHTENKTGTVINRAWDGTMIKLSAARNEVVSFNLVLEAANASASNVSVSFDTLTGQNGATIHSQPTSGNGIFNWVNRPIELFLAKYVKIDGLSYFGYGKHETQIPIRFQASSHLWNDRPDHDKNYPDALVPIELSSTFNIAQGQNQSIWSDIYVPKSAIAGTYAGTLTLKEGGATTRTVPVQLAVSNFALPDSPSAKTMAYVDNSDIMWRYVAGWHGYAQWDKADGRKVQSVMDAHFKLFHRHKLAAIGENECPPADKPCDSALPRLNGSLYTAANGYDGPGVGTGTDVYSIGTYSTWGAASYGIPDWKHDQGLFRQHLGNWATWFAQFLPATQYLLYLEDEPPASDFPQVQTWANWITTDPGPGKAVPSFSTISAAVAQAAIPSLAIAASEAGVGGCPNVSCNNTDVYNGAYSYFSNSNRKFWGYNPVRPGAGSSMTEDDGVAMRTWGWAQFKKSIDRMFYWESNVSSYFDPFATATTWDNRTRMDPYMGRWGDHAASNGNGLLVYPGTSLYPGNTNYQIDGPIASIRLKEWRRGVQDADYLALAKQIDPAQTANIINQVMPKALWEYSVPDPTYVTVPPSYSSNPDTWEAARAQLAGVIATYCASHAGSGFCQ